VPPPNPAPATARDWLARARGKLALARLPLPGDAYFEDLCFLAQQAAELAIKAVYVQFGRKFARIHDLDQLLSEKGRFPRLQDCDDLWQLLFMITTRKAADLVEHERRQKRGGGLVLDEAMLAGTGYDGTG